MNIEAKLQKEGFSKLQEKDDMIYYDKTNELSHSSAQQICLVYDKHNNKISSIKMFILSEDGMSVVDDIQVRNDLQQLLSS